MSGKFETLDPAQDDPELIKLKAQATNLGLKYHHRVGVKKLKERIMEYLIDNPDLIAAAVSVVNQEPDPAQVAYEQVTAKLSSGPYQRPVEVVLPAEQVMATLAQEEASNGDIHAPSYPGPFPGIDQVPKHLRPMTEEEFQASRGATAAKQANLLIRCRVQCMNPMKKEWPGEMISVGSSRLGTFKKFVPFSSEPYHIPKIILDHMKERKCSIFYSHTDHLGHKTKKSRQVSEFVIEELPPLTQKEIQELARRQALAKGQETAQA